MKCKKRKRYFEILFVPRLQSSDDLLTYLWIKVFFKSLFYVFRGLIFPLCRAFFQGSLACLSGSF